jgi:alanine dehydrogenase
MQKALFLSGKDVVGLATMAEFIEAIRDGYRQRGEGASAKPSMRIPSDAGPTPRFGKPASLISYGASMPDSGVMGMYTMCPSSATAGWYLNQLYSSDGEPLAVIDGASWNPIKTGAVGAVGVDALSRDDSSVVALIGSGEQSKGQLVAIEHVRDIERAYVYSPNKEHRESFAKTMQDFTKCDVISVDSSDEAVINADIIVTATKATDPVFDGTKLKEGAHVNAVGQGSEADKREVDEVTVQKSKWVSDIKARTLLSQGAYIYAAKHGFINFDDHYYAELGQIIAGKFPGRESETEITLFDSTGSGPEAVSGGYLLYKKAVEAGVGTEIEFFSAEESFEFTDYIATDW